MEVFLIVCIFSRIILQNKHKNMRIKSLKSQIAIKSHHEITNISKCKHLVTYADSLVPLGRITREHNTREIGKTGECWQPAYPSCVTSSSHCESQDANICQEVVSSLQSTRELQAGEQRRHLLGQHTRNGQHTCR